MCLRRTPTALGSDVVCSTDFEKVVVDQAENIVVIISPTETAFFNRMDGVYGERRARAALAAFLSVAKA